MRHYFSAISPSCTHYSGSQFVMSKMLTFSSFYFKSSLSQINSTSGCATPEEHIYWSRLCFFLFFKDFSPLHHSTSSSLTDTLTSLSSSDSDLSSQREWSKNIFSSEVMNRSTPEVSESEAAKEVLESSRCHLQFWPNIISKVSN